MASDDRRAERQAAARHWAQWLTGQLEAQGLTRRELVELSGGQLGAAQVSRWTSGDSIPALEAALLVGRLLKVTPVEVLRAAGHPAMAEAMDAVRTAGVPMDDPIAEAILAAGFEPRERQELLGQRAADLNRLAEEARAADQRMRAIIEDRKRSR